MTTIRVRLLALVALLAGLPGACGGDDDGTVRLYTSVTAETVAAVVDQFEAATGIEIEVFRAPTGELAARVAAEQREGGIQADVFWLTDPLTMQQYDAEGLLKSWDPVGADGVAPQYRTERFWGTRLLSMVIVTGRDVPAPVAWRDLTDPRYAGRVAMPDPGFAGSALAVLGYLASEPAYGIEYFEALRDNGLVVVNAPGEVVTGVAEGRFDAGITLEFSARTALEKGSPIAIIWPEPGAITLYSPIAVVDGAGGSAQRFVEHALSRDAQVVIAATGWQPIRDDVTWVVGGPQVPVDWASLFDRSEELLTAFRAVVDG